MSKMTLNTYQIYKSQESKATIFYPRQSPNMLQKLSNSTSNSHIIKQYMYKPNYHGSTLETVLINPKI